MMANDDETIRVMFQDGDPHLKLTLFDGNTDQPHFDDEKLPMLVMKPDALFSLRWVTLLYAVLSNLLQSRKLKYDHKDA